MKKSDHLGKEGWGEPAHSLTRAFVVRIYVHVHSIVPEKASHR